MSVAESSAELAAPYLGLRPFETADAPFFFGRRFEVELLAANLRASRTTLVYGESGVGKSSLLRAGLGPALIERGALSRNRDYEGESFAVVIFSMAREDPMPALGAAIRAAVGFDPQADDVPQRLPEAVHEATQEVGRLLLILDQFEQYLEHIGGAEGDGFAADLTRVVSTFELPVHLLVAIREDAISKFDRLGPGARELTSNPIRIEPLGATAAREAIRDPLFAFNEAFDTSYEAEAGFERAVIAATRVGALDLGFGGRGGEASPEQGECGEIEAAYLQLALKSVLDAEREANSSLLRLKTFERLGGLPGIVRSHLDRIMGTLDRSDQRIALLAFRYLVTPSGMKVPYSAWDLSELTNEDPGKIERVLALLADEKARIVRPLGPSPRGDRRYEIYHDRLGDPILDWCARFRRSDDRSEIFQRLSRATALVALVLLGVSALVGAGQSLLIALGVSSLVYALLGTAVGGRLALQSEAGRRLFGNRTDRERRS